MTMNVYGRARNEKMRETVEAVGNMLFDDNAGRETADHGREKNGTFAEQGKSSTLNKDASLVIERDASINNWCGREDLNVTPRVLMSWTHLSQTWKYPDGKARNPDNSKGFTRTSIFVNRQKRTFARLAETHVRPQKSHKGCTRFAQGFYPIPLMKVATTSTNFWSHGAPAHVCEKRNNGARHHKFTRQP
jgi:hypothetical protein